MPNVNDTIAISENIDAQRINSGVQVYIDGVVRSKSLERNSLIRENIITRQVDRAKFVLKKYGDNHTYTPTVGKEVEIYNDGTKIFGGVIVKITQRARDYSIILFDVECEDYTRLLDRKLVVNSYANQTIGQIVEDINTNFLTGFTTSNVEGVDKEVAYIAFNYIPVSQALQRLADLINFDWYVDYDKDIHFFSKTAKLAPFNLADTDGSYIFDSLRIRRDNSQVKNVIYVRGGEYLASTFTTEFISDGVQNVYNLPYRYEDLQTNVTGEIWSQGIDEIDPISQNDYIWNKLEKFIRFRGDRIPNDTSSIRISGQPFLPVRLQVKDEESIASMVSSEGGDGEYEFLIIDNSIDSREGARERASAELESYKDTLSEGSFRTYTDGLEAGQVIIINSTAHGINEDFLINKVTAKMWTHEALIYEVSVVTTKTFGIIEFLQKLLTGETEKIIINEDEILDLVYSKSETATIGEAVVVSTSHNPLSETFTVDESVVEQHLGYIPQFIAGPWAPPLDIRRVFVLNGSHLGIMGAPVVNDGVGITENVNISVV